MNNEILSWLNNQHPWIQEAAYRILCNGNLTPADINELVTIVKKSTVALENSNISRAYPQIGSSGTTNNSLRLVSIGEIQGIEQLAPRKPLSFGDKNLCVIYGHTASGKSGYTRLLKKACAKLGAKELRPDIYKEAPMQRQCNITFSIGGKEKTTTWTANDDAIIELESVDIFDSSTCHIYLDKESQPSFMPYILILFRDLSNACKDIHEILTTEQDSLVKKLPDLPIQFQQTEIKKKYQELRFDMSESDLTTWCESDENELTKLDKLIKIDNHSELAKKRRAVKLQIDKLASSLNVTFSLVNKDTCEKIKKLQENAINKRKIATEGAMAVSQHAKLEGIGTDTWRALWSAAQMYSNTVAYQNNKFPNTEEKARCVLCHQELDAESRKRLNDFEDYISGTLQSEATTAEKLLSESINTLPQIPNEEELTTIGQAAELSNDILNKLKESWIEIARMVNLLKLKSLPDEYKTFDSSCLSLIDDLQKLSSDAEITACQHDENAKNFDMQKTNTQLLEMQAKKWVAQQANAIRSEIARLKKVQQYEEWKKLANTTGISKKTGQLSKSLITEEYIRRFNDELNKLGAKDIKVSLVNSRIDKAMPLHTIQLTGLSDEKHKISEILSEGEHRIVSLAAFLADVTGKPTSTPFIFDDPISSLDQSYEEKTIDRLIELSKDRQVLIFTHRLSLLGLVNDRAEPYNIHIRREPWGTGEPGEIPLFAKKPEDALNNLKNDRLIKAKNAFDNEGHEIYYPLAKAICSDLRILMERIVEIDFLADVVQRHRREVHTKNKIHNLSKITREDCTFVENIMTKYSCYEHSQSNEASVSVPKPKELNDDIDKILTWHTEFKGRKL